MLKTFPRIEDQINFVYWGTQGYEAANITQYGDPNRAGGAHTPRSYNGTAMPGWGEDGFQSVTCPAFEVSAFAGRQVGWWVPVAGVSLIGAALAYVAGIGAARRTRRLSRFGTQPGRRRR